MHIVILSDLDGALFAVEAGEEERNPALVNADVLAYGSADSVPTEVTTCFRRLRGADTVSELARRVSTLVEGGWKLVADASFEDETGDTLARLFFGR